MLKVSTILNCWFVASKKTIFSLCPFSLFLVMHRFLKRKNQTEDQCQELGQLSKVTPPCQMLELRLQILRKPKHLHRKNLFELFSAWHPEQGNYHHHPQNTCKWCKLIRNKPEARLIPQTLKVQLPAQRMVKYSKMKWVSFFVLVFRVPAFQTLCWKEKLQKEGLKWWKNYHICGEEGDKLAETTTGDVSVIP